MLELCAWGAAILALSAGIALVMNTFTKEKTYAGASEASHWRKLGIDVD